MKLTLEVQEDPETGDLYLQFPDELIDQMGWSVGDELDWIDNKDGSWTLTKSSADQAPTA